MLDERAGWLPATRSRRGRRRGSPRATARSASTSDGYVRDPPASRPRRARSGTCAPVTWCSPPGRRATDRLRRQRPPRRDAGRVRPDVLDRFGVAPGERAVVFTTNHRGHGAAFALADAGVDVAAIVDVGAAGRPGDDRRASRRDRRARGWAVVGHRRRPARRPPCTSRAGTANGDTSRPTCCGLRRMEPAAAALARDRGRPPLRRAARVLRPGRRPAPRWLVGRGRRPPATVADRGAVLVRPGATTARDHFVDLQRDATVADIRRRRAGPRSVEHVKRATYIGTASTRAGRPACSRPRS